MAVAAVLGCGLALLSVFHTGALAQSATRPPPIDPFQAERRFQTIESEQQGIKRSPPPIPRLSRPDPKGAHEPLFRLASVKIKDVTAVPLEALAPAYQAYVGRNVSQYDLELIASQISDVYRQAGYHLSRAIIPPQDVKSGHLTILVMEGRIAEVQVIGGFEDRFGVRALLNPLTAERPSQLRTVERQLLLINDIPGVRIADTALEEIGLATGEFRLSVKIETWSVYVATAFDNLGTYAVGPLQAFAATSFHSYLTPGDALSIHLSTVPDATHDLRYGRAAYDVALGNGFRLGVSASQSTVRPDDSRRLLETRILTRSYELRGTFLAIASRERSLALGAAFGFIDSKETDLNGLNYNDRVHLVSLLANYRFRDHLDGWNFIALVLRQGLGGLGASEKGEPLSREGADPSFSALAYSYTRHQQLTAAWSVRASVVGQITSGPVLTSQAFYLGTPAFGPGYYSADNGVLGTAELRFEQPLSGIIKGYQLYSFIDGGLVWNKHQPEQSLSSAGVGVRFQLAHDLQAGFAVAVPLSYSSKTEEFRDLRFLFTLANAFRLCPERPVVYCF